MKDVLTKVAEFHNKHGFPVLDTRMLCPIDNEHAERRGTVQLNVYAARIAEMAQMFEHGTFDNRPAAEGFDPRLLRAHLLMEELAETLKALAEYDAVGVLDGLADIAYVTAGAALTFGLPLAEAIDEVHKSNMTKEVGAGGDKDVRCRKKGDTYVPPNIKGLFDGMAD